MNILKTCLYTALYLVLAWAVPASAYASEQLVYRNNYNSLTKSLLSKYAQNTLKTDLSALRVALHDLNDDGIDELIVKPENCAQANKACDYKILALSGSQILEISSLRARNLVLGNEYNAGIRNLLVFHDTAVNDFEYDVYIWDPARSQYIVSGERLESGHE